MVKKNKKGQAALEFLMTYGWAFLVILIVIGAFVYFDVLNPAKLVPARCTFPAGFDCDEFAIKTGTDNTQFRVVNNQGYTITITGAEIVDEVYGAMTAQPCKVPTANIANGGSALINCTLETISAGERLQADARVSFRRFNGEITQTAVGRLSGEVLTE